MLAKPDSHSNPPLETTDFPSEKPNSSSSKGLVSSRENRFIPIREYMENQSFRDILAQFLEENDPIPPLESTQKTETRAASAPETPFFQWENSSVFAGKAKSAYAQTKVNKPEVKGELTAVTAVKPAAPLKPEPKWNVSELNLNDQRRIKILVQMGANEINGEISMTILKKAHRRLAKKLHPDTSNEKSQDKFLALQSIYEDLSESLSAKASDSESASAPASQRRDAA